MKKLLLVLLVVSSLASCGKKNQTDSGAVSGTPAINQLILNNPTTLGLTSKIDNPATGFGNGYIATANSNQTCGTKWGFNYCYASGSTSTQGSLTWNALLASDTDLIFQYSSGRTVRNNIDVTVASQQAVLREILSRATNIQGDGTIFYVTVSGGYYVIDTRYAIQMNPSGVATQASSDFFLQAI